MVTVDEINYLNKLTYVELYRYCIGNDRKVRYIFAVYPDGHKEILPFTNEPIGYDEDTKKMKNIISLDMVIVDSNNKIINYNYTNYSVTQNGTNRIPVEEKQLWVQFMKDKFNQSEWASFYGTYTENLMKNNAKKIMKSKDKFLSQNKLDKKNIKNNIMELDTKEILNKCKNKNLIKMDSQQTTFEKFFTL